MRSKEERPINNTYGDAAWLDGLVRQHYPDILRYCYVKLKHRQAAEDATQDTFLNAVRYMDRYTHRGKWRAFLYKIALNVCRDYWKRQLAAPHSKEPAQEDAGFERVESADSFDRLLTPLSSEQREVVILRFVQDLRLREIADVLGIPMRTAQTRLRTAVKKMEKGLAEDE